MARAIRATAISPMDEYSGACIVPDDHILDNRASIFNIYSGAYIVLDDHIFDKRVSFFNIYSPTRIPNYLRIQNNAISIAKYASSFVIRDISGDYYFVEIG